MFEVVFRRTDDPDAPRPTRTTVARNVSPFTVEPGKFTYRLVRGELEFADYGQVFAHCRIDRGPWTVVPFTPACRPVVRRTSAAAADVAASRR